MKKSLKKSGLVLALVLLLTLLMSTTVLAAVSRPDGLWVNNIAINRAELSWNKVSGASGYVVYRRMNSGKYKRIKTIKGRNNCRYEDKGLTKAKSCRYKIKAYKKRGSKIQYSKYSKTVYTKIRKTADLQDGSAGLDVDTIPKTIGGMKKLSSSEFNYYYYKGNHMEIGINFKNPNSRYLSMTKNTGNKTITWAGVRIGDSRATVESKLKKRGYIDKMNDVYQLWAGGQFICKFKNNKLASYEHIEYYTS